jgi:hypothetical protein
LAELSIGRAENQEFDCHVMKKFPLTILAASLGLFASSEVKALTVIVDDFTTPQVLPPISNTDPIFTSVSGRVSGPGIIGTERELSLTKTSAATAQASDTLAVSVGAGLQGVNAGSSVTYNFNLLWDGDGEGSGVGVNDFGLTGVDVIDQVAGGNTFNTFFRFLVDVDLSLSAKLTITIFKDAGNFSSITTDYLTGGGIPLLYAIPLSSFVSTGTGADFDDIKAIRMTMATEKGGTDINFDILDFNYTPVPEVSTAVSAGVFALLGGLVLLRSSRKAKA